MTGVWSMYVKGWLQPMQRLANFCRFRKVPTCLKALTDTSGTGELAPKKLPKPMTFGSALCWCLQCNWSCWTQVVEAYSTVEGDANCAKTMGMSIQNVKGREQSPFISLLMCEEQPYHHHTISAYFMGFWLQVLILGKGWLQPALSAQSCAHHHWRRARAFLPSNQWQKRRFPSLSVSRRGVVRGKQDME